MGRQGVMMRVAADSTVVGGNWYSPCFYESKDYLYVPIPDKSSRILSNHQRPYTQLSPEVVKLGVELPDHLAGRMMHLDPDFEFLTYGDRGNKFAMLSKLEEDDIIIFYGAFKDFEKNLLVYAMFGLFVVQEVVKANAVQKDRWHENAHTRRTGVEDNEIIIRGKNGVSGRFDKLIEIGEYRSKAYRLLPNLSVMWGGINTKDDFIMRAAVPPKLNDPVRFYRWFGQQQITLLQNNF